MTIETYIFVKILFCVSPPDNDFICAGTLVQLPGWPDNIHGTGHVFGQMQKECTYIIYIHYCQALVSITAIM